MHLGFKSCSHLPARNEPAADGTSEEAVFGKSANDKSRFEAAITRLQNPRSRCLPHQNSITPLFCRGSYSYEKFSLGAGIPAITFLELPTARACESAPNGV